MANPSLQIGNGKFAIKENDLLGYSSSGTRFFPIPITMTRATLGTRVNPSGLIEDVELLGGDLVTNGDFATDSDWDKTGTWSIESNYATASGNSTSQYIQQDFTITNGKTYLFTYEIIENTLNGVGSALSGSGGFVQIFLSNVIGTHQVYITADDDAAAYALKIGVSATATTGTIKLDNVSVKEVTRDGLARVDYTDGTGSLLVEPQRTNLITYSEDFTNAIWLNVSFGTGVEPVITSNYTTSPDGTNNASRIIFDRGSVGASNASMLRTNITGLTNPHSSSISFYAKSNTASNYTLIWYNESFGSEEIIITPTWTRYTLSSNSLLNTNDRFQFGLWDFVGTTSSTYADVSVWAAQFEENSYPTSYIKTQGSTVTRNKDQYEKTGISDKINSEEGVLFTEMSALSDDLTDRYIMLSDGGWNNRIQLNYENVSNTIEARVFVGGSQQFDTSFVLNDITLNNKFAIKWKVNDFALWVNGVEVDTDSSGSVPSANTLNELSFKDGQGSNNFFGKVRQLQVYKTALSDSELATLTTI